MTILPAALLIGTLVPKRGEAQSLTALHWFATYDGDHPYAGLIPDASGNLYGTTATGGTSGGGTVFKLDTSGNFTLLHSFSWSGGGGALPEASLVLDSSGNLYGTTASAGASGYGTGYGTVFKLDAQGNFTVLHTFAGAADGGTPLGSLIQDSSGYLYGTASGNDAGNPGVVFKLDTSGNNFQVLHAFAGGDGSYPSGGLIQDSSGYLYSTTKFGGASGGGTVFKLDTSGNNFTLLHSFTQFYPDFAGNPMGGLTLDSSGYLYGTTQSGSAVFKLDTQGNNFAFLHKFSYSEGASPSAGVIVDSSGYLYGTTSQGGSGLGVVFMLDTSGNNFSVLYSFHGWDGFEPYGGLILDSSGNLYGTTMGGYLNAGNVFKLSPPPPNITAKVAGTLGNNGWYTSNVTVGWNVAGPAISSQTGCDSTTISNDTTGTTITCTATSAGGTNSQSVTIKRDITQPAISCGAADGLWHAADVSLGCTAGDFTSGLANPAEASFNLTTSVPAGTETSNAWTNSHFVTDRAGNSATAGPVGGNKIDKKAPAIAITSPGATSYVLNQPVAASYLCTDGGSGVALCSGPVANGSNIKTASVGGKTFTVNGADNVGNASSASVNYTVNYNFSGYQPPVNPAPTVNTGKPGKSYPVKWQLRDANGNYITALSAVTSVNYQATACGSFTSDPTDPLEASTTGSSGLRYDSTANQYIYTWASPGTAGCYTLFLTLDSGQVFPAYFNLSN